jgi:hypothetical protein
MNRAKLCWADGHVDTRDDLVAGDVVWQVTPDGRHHIFKVTDETDEDGDDVYREESRPSDE